MRYENTPEFKKQLKIFNDLLEEDPDPNNIITVTLEDEVDDSGNKRSFQYIPYGIVAVDIAITFKGLVQKIIYEVNPFNEGSFCRAAWKVFHPVMEEWLIYDGVGFAPVNIIQAGEFKGSTKAIRANEEKLAIPLSAAEAFKNAAKFCKRFGRDLNKDEDKVYTTRPKFINEQKKERKQINESNRYKLMIDDCVTVDDLVLLNKKLPQSGDVQLYVSQKMNLLNNN